MSACLNVCIVSDDEGRGYYCDECPERRPVQLPTLPGKAAGIVSWDPMTAHDPRVTLTQAEVERLCDALEDSDAEYRVEQRVAREVEHLIAARLAPIRALVDEWATKYGTCGCPTNGGEQLRAALDASSAPVSTSQDHDWHQPLTHCHCGRVVPCRHHDGAEGQGEGERPADRRCPTCGIPFAHYAHDPQGRPL